MTKSKYYYYAVAPLLLSRISALTFASKSPSFRKVVAFMMSTLDGSGGGGRSIQRIVKATQANPLVTRLVGTLDIDGSGTRHALSEVNPFILLDAGCIPKDNMPPFGAHPHRGHSVVTVLLRGRMKSWDSFSNTETTLTAPASYWVDAGSGLFHDEVTVIQNEGDAQQHVGLLQLWIGTKEEDRLKPPRVQHYENVPIQDLLDTSGKIIGQVQYYLGASSSGGIETPHPIVVAHVRQNANTQCHFPIDPRHMGFVLNLNGSDILHDSGSEENPASFGGTTPSHANDVLVLENDSTQDGYLAIQSGDGDATYMVIVGETIDEPWAKKLVANGAVIAASPDEAREIATQVEAYAAAGKQKGGSFAPFGV
jgi:redox-sensitive bicupin YhaK (pirin superfamily)